MGTKATFKLSGLDEYLAKIQAAGNNIEEAVTEAIKASVKPVQRDIEAWADRHELTGAVKKGVISPVVIQDGNNIYTEAGVDGEDNSWHAVFVEYGTPTNAADPGIRRAFESNKARVKKIQREILQGRGVPID